MRIKLTILALLLLTFAKSFGAESEAKRDKTQESKWSLDFLIVDETGRPLPGVTIFISCLDTSKPGAVTITNWAEHMSRTNVVTDNNGSCNISGIGTPDAWQCNFSKPGYQKKFRMYSGPSNFTGFSGPGPAIQKHTEMLVSNNALMSAYPKWSMTIKAIDDSGNPVEGVKAEVFYHKDQTATGLTDVKGLFSYATNLMSWDIGLDIKKAGYYDARKTIHLGDRENYDPAKWIQTVPLLLIKKNPMPMYAKRQEMKLQKEDEPLAFDLEAGGWVAPNGKGEHTDVLFSVHRKIIDERKYDCTLTVTFPNKGDGLAIAPAEPDMSSECKTSRTAVENGYQPEFVLHYSHTNQPASVFGYFIRVRTVLDEQGNVKNALYGKIRGNFRFYAGTIKPHSGMGFDYYLNPTPNDRNVEFDPKQNLLKNLDWLEQVKDP